jgi:L-fuconolactonase
MTEPILEPDLPIIDPHHHLWDLSAKFFPPESPLEHGYYRVARRASRYLLPELLADLQSGHNIRATVFVQCRSMYRAAGPEAYKPVGETEFANGIAAMSASGTYGATQICAGIVSHVDLTIGAAAREVLEAHVRAAGGRLRGIRHFASYDADPAVLGPLARTPGGLYLSKTFRSGFAQLGKLGLSFDAWLLEPQLPELIDLARSFPDQAIILDHVGTPLGIASYENRRAERFPMWRDSIRKLASMPNVSVKLGGLAMSFCNFPSFLQQPPAASSQLAKEWRPYLETVIDAFGPNRCMFESNFPVDRGGCSYAVLWNAFKLFAADCSADEKKALFYGNAKRVYKLNFQDAIG